MNIRGNSLEVQWLGLSTFTAGAWVRSLGRELRSRNPHGTAKKQKQNKQTKMNIRTGYRLPDFKSLKQDKNKWNDYKAHK